MDSMNPAGGSALGTETWFEMYNVLWGANVAVGVTAVAGFELAVLTFVVALPFSEPSDQEER